jgi:hypothetical protein
MKHPPLTHASRYISKLPIPLMSEFNRVSRKVSNHRFFVLLNYFINNRFEPPGMISAGMSCYLHITFEPKVD